MTRAGLPEQANLVLLLAVLAFLAWTAAFGSFYDIRVLSIAGIYALLALGYQFILGQAGALSLAQAAFMGVGAYTSGILELRLGLAFDASLVLAIGAPVLLAAAVAAPVLRLNTHYFALATLIISQVCLLVANEWQSLTGGANGLDGVSAVTLFGIPIAPGLPLLAVTWSFVALGALLAWQCGRGELGKSWALMRASPSAASSIGLDQPKLRLIAFLLSAAYGGLAGALYAHTLHVISTDALSLPVMIACLTAVIIGGRTQVGGALAGAVLVTEMPEWFRGLHDWYLLAYGAILLVVVIAAPGGLVGAIQLVLARLRPAGRIPAPMARPLPARSFSHSGALLRVDGLSKQFGGVHAVDDLSLTIDDGASVGLIGPNGSGKTTAVNLITGFYRPDRGRIELAGADISRWPAHLIARAGIGRTFQTAALVDEMSVLDTVALARFGAHVGAKDVLRVDWRNARLDGARAEAADLLARMGVLDAASAPCGVLPYGLRRRVEIARALALQPRLLLLDEPAAGLNETEQADLARRLRGLKSDGVALLVIEHNLAFLSPLVERMICLDHGRVIAEGSPAEVQRAPLVVEAYLGGAVGPIEALA